MTKRINKQIGTDWNRVDFVIHQEALFVELEVVLTMCPENMVSDWEDKYHDKFRNRDVNRFFFGDYESLYTEEMIDWVLNAEEKIIKNYYG